MENNTIQQIKMDNLKNSFNFIHSLLNRCTTKGQFTLDEAYLAKINLNNIYTGIDILEKYQNAVNNMNNNVSETVDEEPEKIVLEKKIDL